jgi:hypothetical protein
MKEWFVWALQSNQPISNLDRLLEQIDLKAYELASNIIKWKLPKIPGFKGGEEELFDEFEQLLTDAELAQLTAQIERSTRVAESRDWTQIL